MLEEKPFNKISVKNIAERAKINRNTFYNHFHNIPELLEILIKEYSDNIIQQHKNFDEPLDCLYKCISVGIIIDWLDDGMNYDLAEAFKRLCYLFSGMEKQAFLKSSSCSENK